MDPNTGTIFNIQKFSVNDGPGIRTTVFLKGCPLRCQWCANPESQHIRPELFHDPAKCLHCRHCETVCDQHAIHWTNGFHADPCIGCGKCVKECPTGSLRLEGYESTIEAIMQEVLQDTPFYEESGGGLTLSGGEMASQPEFSKALLKAAKENGLDTAVETTGYAPKDAFITILKYTDHVLFDVKHYDETKHKEGTGVSNRIILENLKAAAKTSDVLVRIPVIPGFNSTLEDARNFSHLFNNIGISCVQLLPFHQFGQNKYGLLHKDYAYENTKALHEEDLRDFQQVFTDHGIEAFF